MNLKKNISQRMNKRKVIKKITTDYKNEIVDCPSEKLKLQEILEEIEDNPCLSNKKKRGLKKKILSTLDLPEYILQKLENDKDQETKYWAHDTRDMNERAEEAEEPKIT